MDQTPEKRARRRSNVSLSILALVAIGGWGTFAYSALSSAEAEKQFHGRIAALQEYQMQYLSQRKKAEATAAELVQLRERLSSAQSEASRLSARYDEVEAELSRVQSQLATAQQVYRTQDAKAGMALVHIKPRPTKRDVIAAQEVLTELRYGTLEADGVVGPETRQAIEAYQRTMGLPVTGDLHAETLQALLHADRFMAAQDQLRQATIQ